LEGKVISADAGILKAPLVQKVVEKKGYIGLSKGNQPELRQAIERWLADCKARPPHGVTVNKGHGGVEQRQVWLKPWGELSQYL